MQTRFLAPLLLAFLPTLAHAQDAPAVASQPQVITINPANNRGAWQGWGCSFAWWANAVGGKRYSDLYADLFFSTKTVSVLNREVPGLGMNIIRYNIGGGGRGESIGETVERRPDILSWDRDIDGFWLNWNDKTDAPGSKSWDWNRDRAQRLMVDAAVKRGVNRVELFSNAPMWWMMDSKSSAGGRLQTWNQHDFSLYIATIAKHAKNDWHWPLASIEPFNEPAAGWWTYPKNQEGCNISRDEQAAILPLLREELDARGLKDLPIAASDENSMNVALETYESLKAKKVDGLVGRVNVHSYNGLSPYRDNAVREKLRQSVGEKPLWASEFGGNDAPGQDFAQTVLEDINFLKPSAWIYWQALEPKSPWGPINGDFGHDELDFESGKPTQIYNKYFVFAQFSRFIRDGDLILNQPDPNTVASLDRNDLKIVTMNTGDARTVAFDLSGFKHVGKTATVTQTRFDGTKQFVVSTLALTGERVELNADAKSIYSIEIPVS